MEMSPVNPTLGTQIKRRRSELGIRPTAAARIAGVARSTWATWENDENTPADANWPAIELVCQWEAGSVRAILAGGAPTPLKSVPDDNSNVVPLRPRNAQEDEDEDDETIRELRAAPIGDDLRTLLIANYRAEKARDLQLRRHEDEERRRRYLKIAEAAGE